MGVFGVIRLFCFCCLSCIVIVSYYKVLVYVDYLGVLIRCIINKGDIVILL